jgi:hypothetical protein
MRGGAWSGGAGFDAVKRRDVRPLCKTGDAAGAARSTPRRDRAARSVGRREQCDDKAENVRDGRAVGGNKKQRERAA